MKIGNIFLLALYIPSKGIYRVFWESDLIEKRFKHTNSNIDDAESAVFVIVNHLLNMGNTYLYFDLKAFSMFSFLFWENIIYSWIFTVHTFYCKGLAHFPPSFFSYSRFARSSHLHNFCQAQPQLQLKLNLLGWVSFNLAKSNTNPPTHHPE